jgi:hypothetical protein
VVWSSTSWMMVGCKLRLQLLQLQMQMQMQAQMQAQTQVQAQVPLPLQSCSHSQLLSSTGPSPWVQAPPAMAPEKPLA